MKPDVVETLSLSQIGLKDRLHQGPLDKYRPQGGICDVTLAVITTETLASLTHVINSYTVY